MSLLCLEPWTGDWEDLAKNYDGWDQPSPEAMAVIVANRPPAEQMVCLLLKDHQESYHYAGYGTYRWKVGQPKAPKPPTLTPTEEMAAAFSTGTAV